MLSCQAFGSPLCQDGGYRDFESRAQDICAKGRQWQRDDARLVRYLWLWPLDEVGQQARYDFFESRCARVQDWPLSFNRGYYRVR